MPPVLFKKGAQMERARMPSGWASRGTTTQQLTLPGLGGRNPHLPVWSSSFAYTAPVVDFMHVSDPVAMQAALPATQEAIAQVSAPVKSYFEAMRSMISTRAKEVVTAVNRGDYEALAHHAIDAALAAYILRQGGKIVGMTAEGLGNIGSTRIVLDERQGRNT